MQSGASGEEPELFGGLSEGVQVWRGRTEAEVKVPTEPQVGNRMQCRKDPAFALWRS